jgi:hypothetical protein
MNIVLLALAVLFIAIGTAQLAFRTRIERWRRKYFDSAEVPLGKALEPKSTFSYVLWRCVPPWIAGGVIGATALIDAISR